MEAGFTAVPTSGVAPLAVAFTNESSGDYADSLWDFGDGVTSTLESPNHTYTSGGVYTVALTVSGLGGVDTLTRTQYVTAYTPVEAGFTAVPTSGVAPLTATLTNESSGDYTDSLWDFGDGVTSTLESPNHTYTSGGVYTVTLTVSGPGGTDTLTKTGYITVYEAVQVGFEAAPLSGTAPLTVTFTNTTSGDADSYLWSYGDGLTGTISAVTHPHVYTIPGVYTVSLTAQGPGGTDALTKTDYITVTGVTLPPVAGFWGVPLSGTAPLTVTFTNTTTGDVTTYLWRYGDSLTGTSSAVTHTHVYTIPGVYTVSLTAQGPGGTDTLTKTNYVTAYEAVQVGFEAAPLSGEAPLTVTFTNTTSGDAADYLWNYGDGLTGIVSATTHTHVYTVAGVHTVSLTASGPGGTDTLTKTDYISVTGKWIQTDWSGGPSQRVWADPTRFWDQDSGVSVNITGEVRLRLMQEDEQVSDADHRATPYGEPAVAATINADDDLYVYAAWVDPPPPFTSPVMISGTSVFLHSYQNGQWLTDTSKINPDQEGVHVQVLVDVAVDAEGNAYVVWADDRQSDWDIYIQKVVSTTQALAWGNGNGVQVNHTISYGVYHPVVTVGGDGFIYVAWEDGIDTIYVQKLNPASGAQVWASDVEISEDTDIGFLLPDIGVDDDGNSYVTWRSGDPDYSSDSTHIYVQSIDTYSQTRWSESVVISATEIVSASLNYPAIATDGTGNSYVVWVDDAASSNSADWRIYAQKFNTNGQQVWVEDLTVGTVFQGQNWPDVVLDGDDAFVVVWGDGIGGDNHHSIYAQRYDASGEQDPHWPPNNARVSGPQTGASTAQPKPSVVVVPTGDIYIAWQDERNGSDVYDVYMQKLSVNGIVQWLSSDYYSKGKLTSSIYGPGRLVDWGTITWTETLSPSTGVAVEVSWDQGQSWMTATKGLEIGASSDALMYRLILESNGTQTPVLEEIAVEYGGNPTQTTPADVYLVEFYVATEDGSQNYSYLAGQKLVVHVTISNSSTIPLPVTLSGITYDGAGRKLAVMAGQELVTAPPGVSYHEYTIYVPVLQAGGAYTHEAKATVGVQSSSKSQVVNVKTLVDLPTPTEFEKEVIQEVNEERTAVGLAPLKYNEALFYASRRHSHDMASHDFEGHQGSDGSWHWERAEDEGYDAMTLHENLASNAPANAGTLVGAWMSSAYHRQAILSANSREVGFAYQEGFGTMLIGGRSGVLPVFLDDDAEATASRAVSLTISNDYDDSDPPPPILQVAVNFVPDFSEAEWQTYTRTAETHPEGGTYYAPLIKDLTLPPEPGLKSIYVAFKRGEQEWFTRDTILYVPSEPANSPVPPLPPAMAYFQSPLFVGAATFDYPIEVAPGTAGLEPSLVLRYDSYAAGEGWDRQSGWAGSGMSLDLGYVARRPDGTSTNAGDDTFVLYLNGVYYPLVYSDPAWGGDGYYHTERETFWRIERKTSECDNGVSGGDCWLVTTGDGTQHRFGYNADSAWRYQDGGGGTHIYRYNLDRIEDTHGNYLTASYDRDTASGYERGGYLAQIDYTANDDTNPDTPALRRVTFDHTSREIGGQKDYDAQTDTFYLTDKLDTITVQVSDGQDWDLVRTYELTYTYQSGHLVLTGITHEGSDGTSVLEETTLSYHTSGAAQGRLASAGNNYGAEVSFTYESFESPTGTARLRVHTLTADPGTGSMILSNGDGATTSLNYGDVAESPQGFLGHTLITVTDALSLTGEVRFRWDDIFWGLPYKRICTDCCENSVGTQGLLEEDSGPCQEQIHNYAALSSHNGVDFVYVTSDVDVTVLSSGEDERQTSYEYDDYGNVTTMAEYGDAADAADDRYTFYTYTYNTTAWIVDRVATEIVEDVAGAKLAETHYYYDGHTGLADAPTEGDLTRVERMLLKESRAVRTDYEYDAYGNVTAVTDPEGNETMTIYDDVYHTFPVEVRYPQVNGLDMSATWEYDVRWGVVTTTTDVNGQTTEFDYDAHGRQLRVWEPLDAGSGTPTVEYEYNDNATPYRFVTTRRKEAYGGTDTLDERAYYNGDGQLLQIQREAEDSGQVIVVDYTYDELRRPASASVPYTTTQTGSAYLTPDTGQPSIRYTYDRKGRITGITNSDDTTVRVGYRGWRTKTVEDENDHVRRYTYDGLGRQVQVEEFTGSLSAPPYAITSYEYDALGRLERVTDTEGNVTTIVYDSLGRKKSMTDPDMGAWTYTFDDNGNLLTQTDDRGVVTEMTWDAWDRPLTKTFSGGAPEVADTPVVTYTYDQGTYGKGRLAAVDNGISRQAYTYDAVGRIKSETVTVGGDSYATGYAYDPMGRVLTTTYPGGEQVTHSYNDQGLLETLNGAVDYVTGVEYNVLGQPTRLEVGNGRTTIYRYEPETFRLSRLTTDDGLQDLRYTYDAVGNVQTFLDTVAAISLTYGYDPLDRLTSVSGTYSHTYAYDPLGNLTNKVGVTQYYTGTRPHAITRTSDGKAFAYDANGNMTDRDGQTLTWDAENRLTEVVSGTTTVRFSYDGQGRRVKKEVVSGTTTETTIYVAPHFEVAVSGTQIISTSYYYALGRAVAMRTKEGVTETVYYLHGDHLGSTSVMSDEDGNEVGRVSYYPFGEVYTATGTLATDRMFTGQRLDETGLYHYSARYYDSVTGRFTQPDIIVPNPYLPQDLNRYTYVRNSPLRYSDRSGHYTEDEIMTAFEVTTWDEVLDLFRPGGALEGLWGWLEILRRANDGDMAMYGAFQTTRSNVTLTGATIRAMPGNMNYFGRDESGHIFVGTLPHYEFAVCGRGHIYSLLQQDSGVYKTLPRQFHFHPRLVHGHPDWVGAKNDLCMVGLDALGTFLFLNFELWPWAQVLGGGVLFVGMVVDSKEFIDALRRIFDYEVTGRITSYDMLDVVALVPDIGALTDALSALSKLTGVHLEYTP